MTVAVGSTPDPEVAALLKRRQFSGAYKHRRIIRDPHRQQQQRQSIQAPSVRGQPETGNRILFTRPSAASDREGSATGASRAAPEGRYAAPPPTIQIPGPTAGTRLLRYPNQRDRFGKGGSMYSDGHSELSWLSIVRRVCVFLSNRISHRGNDFTRVNRSPRPGRSIVASCLF
jgi:hypothetical protein